MQTHARLLAALLTLSAHMNPKNFCMQASFSGLAANSSQFAEFGNGSTVLVAWDGRSSLVLAFAASEADNSSLSQSVSSLSQACSTSKKHISSLSCWHNACIGVAVEGCDAVHALEAVSTCGTLRVSVTFYPSQLTSIDF